MRKRYTLLFCLMMCSPAQAFAQADQPPSVQLSQEAIQKRIQDDANAVNALYNSCISRAISVSQFKTDASAIISKLLLEKVIAAPDYLQMNTEIQNSANRCEAIQNHVNYVEKANEAFASGRISEEDLKREHAKSLTTLLNNNIITQNDYNDSLELLDRQIAEFKRQQAVASAQQQAAAQQQTAEPAPAQQQVPAQQQAVAPAQQQAAAPAQQQAAAPAQQQASAQQTTTPTQQPTETSQSAQTAVQNSHPSLNDSNIRPYFEKLHNVILHEDTIGDARFKEKYSEIVDNMLKDGVISQEDHGWMMDNANNYRMYANEIQFCNDKYEKEKIILKDWETCVVDETNRRKQKGMLPSVYIDILNEWIQSYKEEAHRKYDFDVDKYVKYCDGFNCDKTDVKRYQKEDFDRRSSREFRLTVGIQGGVIFDELSGDTKYWAGREDEETLGYVGGRIDFAFIALPGTVNVNTAWGFGGGLRQELGGGFYLSDSVDYNPQFIGSTIAYVRFEFQYQARVII
ncbi:MAG: hypothetical protein J6A01_05545, partial [Proteobacteria bacterium]|nr:hypothetical protein [Pseudomonadota bacterium]